MRFLHNESMHISAENGNGRRGGRGVNGNDGMAKFPVLCTRVSAVLACLVGMMSAAEPAGADEPTSPASGVRAGFVDVTETVGLSYVVATGDEEDAAELSEGRREDGGITLADIDGDGWPELYVAHGAGEPGRLFSWDGHRFVRSAENGGIAPTTLDRAGYFIDLDGDSVPDFLSIQAEGTQAFRNDGSGRFTELPTPFGTGTDRSVYSMAAADYDGDGDLDPFFAHWNLPWNGIRPPARYLWRNDGKGRYEDVSHTVPVRPGAIRDSDDKREFSFTPTFADIDGDGDPDILLAADFGASQVLRNDGGGFTDITGSAITDENGMGAAVGDYDLDGDMDWFVTSIHDPEGGSRFGPTGNRLYRNVGDGHFEDATDAAGVREGGWGWGCLSRRLRQRRPPGFVSHQWLVRRIRRGRGRRGAGDHRVPRGSVAALRGQRRRHLHGARRGVGCAAHGPGTGRRLRRLRRRRPGGHPHRQPRRRAHCLPQRLRETPSLARDRPRRPACQPQGHRRTGHGEDGLGQPGAGGAAGNRLPLPGRRRLCTSAWAPTKPRSRSRCAGPAPAARVTRLGTIAADRRIIIYQAEPEGHLLRVVRGTGAGHHGEGESAAISAEPARGHYRFSHWSAEGGGTFADARAPVTIFAMPAGPATVFAHYLPGPSPADAGTSVARRWMEVLLQAIRDDFARPTVHARNLFHLSAAMYDAWAAWSETATSYRFGASDAPCPAAAPSADGDLRRARAEAISHSAWRLIRHRFQRSPGAASTLRNADTLMAALGFDSGASAALGPAAALGACIGAFYIARGLEDGSNEANDYASIAYRPVNEALEPAEPGNPALTDPDRWQPLDLKLFVGQSGFVEDDIPEFVTPEWGRVAPFALSAQDLTVHRRDDTDWRVYHDPGPPPTLRGPLGAHYKWGFALVARWSAALSPEDGVLIDIAPSGIGNIQALPRRPEDYPAFYDGNPHGPGHGINPATAAPYEPQVVPLGDYTRVLAEFWADGPDSETPPGHWFVILNAVSDHPALVRRLGGEGPVLDRLEWDVKTYFALGGAMHDAAVASWGIKGWYDYVRPISALRFMADRGQSSDPALPSWSPDGILLSTGFIELVGPDDPLAGEDGAHVGKIKVRAWRGPDRVADPATDAAGVGWILAENWWPYQRPSFVTPPFAGYVSGHSTYSRAAAEVLTALTGDPFFPGGMSAFPVPANDFLVFERGPSVDMTLQWATYRDAADQCSLSRIWGGIHPPADDIPGRLIGERVGRDGVMLALSLFAGGE